MKIVIAALAFVSLVIVGPASASFASTPQESIIERATLLDPDLPSAYLRFEQAGRRSPLRIKDPEEGITFRFYNNTTMAVVMCTYGVHIATVPLTLPNGEYVSGMRNGQQISLCYSVEEDQGFGMYRTLKTALTIHLFSYAWVPSGSSVLFFVPGDYLIGDNWRVSVDFSYDWEMTSRQFCQGCPSRVSHQVSFYSQNRPPQVSELTEVDIVAEEPDFTSRNIKVYELTEVDIVAEEPDFTSRNISVLGLKVGDWTNVIDTAPGEIDNTRPDAEDYITGHLNGGVWVFTSELTGRARRIEITSHFSEALVSGPLQAWLDDGDLNQMRELMGPEDTVEESLDQRMIEYVYDARGIRFVQYPGGDQTFNAIRFSEYFD